MKKLLLGIVAVVMGVSLLGALTVTPAWAEDDNKSDKCANTAILKSEDLTCDDGNGSSIIGVLRLVVEIMTIGVGILGVVGITIVGTQYLTAGGNEEQTRKAKRRMFEIVIGIVAYVVLYALLAWLLPGFSPFQ